MRLTEKCTVVGLESANIEAPVQEDQRQFEWIIDGFWQRDESILCTFTAMDVNEPPLRIDVGNL
jgi:hypothetical protein